MVLPWYTMVIWDLFTMVYHVNTMFSPYIYHVLLCIYLVYTMVLPYIYHVFAMSLPCFYLAGLIRQSSKAISLDFRSAADLVFTMYLPWLDHGIPYIDYVCNMFLPYITMILPCIYHVPYAFTMYLPCIYHCFTMHLPS